MIELSPDATGQVESLVRSYEEKGRPEAITNLRHAIASASSLIQADPGRGLSSPRPYPRLMTSDRVWLKVSRYWFAYLATPPHTISAVFFETANIPGRYRP